MELLPDFMQFSFALALWFGSMIAVAIGIVWLWKWYRNYRDDKSSAVDT